MNAITIKSIEDEKELRFLKDFMLKQSQHYPNYKSWVDGKCKHRIESGEYKNIIALSEGVVIGDAIYRELNDKKIEIKNFRIDPNYRNQDLGHFLFSQILKETKNSEIILDVTVDNFTGVEFFIRNGFNIVDKKNLYFVNQEEYIMFKRSA